MKKSTVFFVLVLGAIFALMGCGQSNAVQAQTTTGKNDEQSISSEPSSEKKTEGISNTLVVYFSVTGTTKTLAEYAADVLNADIYEIVPKEPYTEADIAYYTDGRADREQNDPASRPELSGSMADISQYDTIVLGYPIWHGQAPRIISTFLESYDFSGKTIVPFCTSHSSAIGNSATNLHSLCTDTVKWKDGTRFASGTTKEKIKSWLDALQKLGVDYIDLMLLHHPGDGDVEAYKAMEQAVADGKIRSIGLSNWYIEEMDDFLPQVTITPAVVQNEIHPYYQESAVIDYMHSLGIVMEGWYPLGGRGHTQELLHDETIAAIANAHERSSAQVILRWNLQKGVVVIPGSSNPEHIKENISLFDFELSEDELAQINALNRDEKHDWY